MTTREHLRRRVWRARYGVIALLLGLIALQTLVTRLGVLDQLLRPTALLGLGVAVLYLYLSPCLNCRKPLGLTAFRIMGGAPRRASATTAHCPHCEASIDRDFPGSRGS